MAYRVCTSTSKSGMILSCAVGAPCLGRCSHLYWRNEGSRNLHNGSILDTSWQGCTTSVDGPCTPETAPHGRASSQVRMLHEDVALLETRLAIAAF